MERRLYVGCDRWRYKALPQLIALLGSERWGVRVTAALALGDLEDPAAIDPLKTARKREPLLKRRHFTKALLRITLKGRLKRLGVG